MAVENSNPDQGIIQPVGTGIDRPAGGSLDINTNSGLPTVSGGKGGGELSFPHLDAIDQAHKQFAEDKAGLGPIAGAVHDMHESTNGMQTYSVDATGKAYPQVLGTNNASRVDKWTRHAAVLDDLLGLSKTVYQAPSTNNRPNTTK